MKAILFATFAPALFVAIFTHIASGKISWTIYGFVWTAFFSFVLVTLPILVISALGKIILG